jgi:LysR family transcriptional activator of glutamate synthase operon
MTLDQLQAFLAIAERGQLTEAARRLGVPQPTLSRQLQALEKEVSARLLVRTPRGTVLTDSGARFLRHAREAVDALRQGTAELHELSNLPRGPVAIGALSTVGAYLLPALLGAFIKEHPEVQVRLAEALAGPLEERVANGELDFIITTQPLHRQELVAQKLWVEPFMLVVPRGHRLARGGRAVPLGAVAGEPLIVVPGTSAEASLRAACEERGQEPRIGMEVESAESQRRMVERGLGVALLPAIMLRDHKPGLCEVVEVQSAPRRTVALVHRGERSLTYGARALKRFVLERLRDQKPWLA